MRRIMKVLRSERTLLIASLAALLALFGHGPVLFKIWNAIVGTLGLSIVGVRRWRSRNWRAWNNGYDTIIGPTLDAALKGCREQIDDTESYRNPREWSPVSLDKVLTIHCDDAGTLGPMTIREHIRLQRKDKRGGYVSNLLCSTEY